MLDREQDAEQADIASVVRQVYEDGRAYAEAEVALAKAKGRAKIRALKVPLALFGAAAILAISAVGLLLWTLAAALATLIGPLAAGLVIVIGTLVVAGVMAKIGADRLEKMP